MNHGKMTSGFILGMLGLPVFFFYIEVILHPLKFKQPS